MTSQKMSIFWLVTTRPIVHSGRLRCIRNCISEFAMDTGQSLVTSSGMSNYLSDHHKAYYTNIEMYIQMYNAMCHMGTWENFLMATKPIFFVIKRTVLVPGGCQCICIRATMHYVHTGEVVVTSQKMDIFMLVTTRPIAHSGRLRCIRNCVGEFAMNTGQSLVTSSRMLNYLRDHHKAYYTYIEMYIQMYNAMCHMDTWEKF